MEEEKDFFSEGDCAAIFDSSALDGANLPAPYVGVGVQKVIRGPLIGVLIIREGLQYGRVAMSGFPKLGPFIESV